LVSVVELNDAVKAELTEDPTAGERSEKTPCNALSAGFRRPVFTPWQWPSCRMPGSAWSTHPYPKSPWTWVNQQ